MLGAKDVSGGFGYIRSSTHTALNVLEKVWELQVWLEHCSWLLKLTYLI